MYIANLLYGIKKHIGELEFYITLGIGLLPYPVKF